MYINSVLNVIDSNVYCHSLRLHRGAQIESLFQNLACGNEWKTKRQEGRAHTKWTWHYKAWTSSSMW